MESVVTNSNEFIVQSVNAEEPDEETTEEENEEVDEEVEDEETIQVITVSEESYSNTTVVYEGQLSDLLTPEFVAEPPDSIYVDSSE